MTERHVDTLTLFIAADDDARDGDGTVERPFASLGEVLAELETHGDARFGQSAAVRSRRIEVVCLQRAGVAPRPGGRPQHLFFVDPTAAAEGDGSELRPWASLGAAAADLRGREAAGRVSLQTGQRLCIVQRDVFTPTALERWKRRKELLARFVFLAMALTCVLPVVAILGYLLVKGWPALSLDFLLTNPRHNLTAGGIWAPLIGTFSLVVSSLLIAAPIGVLAGVYLNEYARDNWMTRIINLAVVNLAGVPSIVHALFGVGAFVYFAHLGKSLLAASCTVAVMTLPVIITSTREALAAVPMAFREACWNMGASRWQTIRTIVLPNSIAGILTGVILQVARAAGETAPILFTGAVLFVPPVADTGWESLVPYGAGDRFMALSYHLFTLCTQIRGVSDELLYGTAVVLIGLVLAVNSLSIVLRIYLRARKRW
jgi:phosphate transport system permease protein